MSTLSLAPAIPGALSSPQGARTALRDAPFREAVAALHRSNVFSHSHKEIPLICYNLSVRHLGVLKETPELLRASLRVNQWLQHPQAWVQCRCYYVLF